MAKLSVKDKIARKQAEKSIEDRVYAAFADFTEAEEEDVKRVLIELFDLKVAGGRRAAAADAAKDKDKAKAAAKADVADVASPKKDYKYAKKVEPGERKSRRGRKPGTKIVKADAGKDVAVKADKADAKINRGRKGNHATLHEEVLLKDISNILKNSGSELSLKEIREQLFVNGYEEHRGNKSFQPRLSGLLNKWCVQGKMKKTAHGVYALA
jgi:hypothetical protein